MQVVDLVLPSRQPFPLLQDLMPETYSKNPVKAPILDVRKICLWLTLLSQLLVQVGADDNFHLAYSHALRAGSGFRYPHLPSQPL